MSQERRHAFYTGQVQGVGFRYTTCRIAGRYEVTGYVRNLPDGRVELVAEGDSAELNRFLAEVAERMADGIRSIAIEPQPAIGALSSFEIRH